MLFIVVMLIVLSRTRALELLILVAILRFVWRRTRRRSSSSANTGWRPAPGADPSTAVLDRSRQLGGGVYLGTSARGDWRLAKLDRAVLLLGPPRAGKTSGVIIPALLAHAGPAVSTSTKPDVLAATRATRVRYGRAWRFDPTGTANPVDGVRELRWSPVVSARSWDGALLMARSMVTGSSVGQGTTDATHWSRRAQALLAPLLHAAAVSGVGIDRVHAWVLGHDLDTPAAALNGHNAGLAVAVLQGLQKTDGRERSSILSAAADALDAYSSRGALAAASDPNFDADRFVRSNETIYIYAPAEQQQLVAPLVCGLLSEIRAATYRAHAADELDGRVLFALDEAANIAPLAELPAIASEGGGQGLKLLAAFQDLSQARARWGAQADGFLTLFGAKLILPGIADQRTLESVSVALGEYDRPMVSTTHTPLSWFATEQGRTYSTDRQSVLSAGEIANIPIGRGLYLDGVVWELVTLTPAHTIEPWRSLTGGLR